MTRLYAKQFFLAPVGLSALALGLAALPHGTLAKGEGAKAARGTDLGNGGDPIREAFLTGRAVAQDIVASVPNDTLPVASPDAAAIETYRGWLKAHRKDLTDDLDKSSFIWTKNGPGAGQCLGTEATPGADVLLSYDQCPTQAVTQLDVADLVLRAALTHLQSAEGTPSALTDIVGPALMRGFQARLPGVAQALNAPWDPSGHPRKAKSVTVLLEALARGNYVERHDASKTLSIDGFGYLKMNAAATHAGVRAPIRFEQILQWDPTSGRYVLKGSYQLTWNLPGGAKTCSFTADVEVEPLDYGSFLRVTVTQPFEARPDCSASGHVVQRYEYFRNTTR